MVSISCSYMAQFFPLDWKTIFHFCNLWIQLAQRQFQQMFVKLNWILLEVFILFLLMRKLNFQQHYVTCSRMNTLPSQWQTRDLNSSSCSFSQAHCCNCYIKYCIKMMSASWTWSFLQLYLLRKVHIFYPLYAEKRYHRKDLPKTSQVPKLSLQVQHSFSLILFPTNHLCSLPSSFGFMPAWPMSM
jgi:hypothetical protein